MSRRRFASPVLLLSPSFIRLRSTKALTPGTIINDAPIFIDPRLTGGELWEPRNYDNKFDGPMSLAMAFAQVEEPRLNPRDAGHRRPLRAGVRLEVRF